MAFQLNCNIVLVDTGEPGTPLGNIGFSLTSFTGQPEDVQNFISKFSSADMRQRLFYLAGIASAEVVVSKPLNVTLDVIPGLSPPIKVLP